MRWGGGGAELALGNLATPGFSRAGTGRCCLLGSAAPPRGTPGATPACRGGHTRGGDGKGRLSPREVGRDTPVAAKDRPSPPTLSAQRPPAGESLRAAHPRPLSGRRGWLGLGEGWGRGLPRAGTRVVRVHGRVCARGAGGADRPPLPPRCSLLARPGLRGLGPRPAFQGRGLPGSPSPSEPFTRDCGGGGGRPPPAGSVSAGAGGRPGTGGGTT